MAHKSLQIAVLLISAMGTSSPSLGQEFLNPFIREVPRAGYPGNISASVTALTLGSGEHDPEMADKMLANTVRLFPLLESLSIHPELNATAEGYRVLENLKLKKFSGGSRNPEANEVLFSAVMAAGTLESVGVGGSDELIMSIPQAKYSQLRSASLGGGPELTERGIHYFLDAVDDLEELYVSGPDLLTPELYQAISEMKWLRSLRIDIRVGELEMALRHLGRSQSLEFLTVSIDENDAPVPNAAMRNIAQCDSLKQIRFVFGRMSNEGLSELAELDRLEELRIDRADDITHEGLAPLANLHRLRSLRLNHAQITGTGLAHLTDLDGLQILNLAESDLTAEAIPHLREMESLRALDVTHTPLTENRGWEELVEMQNLRLLSLYLADIDELREIIERMPNTEISQWIE